MNRALSFLILLSAVLTASPARAVNLGVPVGCDYGKECYISRYYDHESKEEGKAVDYTCSYLSSDGYGSTDFMLKDSALMERGVPVLAGDEGTVVFVRDGMQDADVTLVGEEAVRGRECGNGVILSHERGYRTEYCHLKKDSVAVRKGDKVEQGDKLGEIGMSGSAAFPYLQFTVLRDGVPADPFTGEDPVTEALHIPCGSASSYPLWDKKTERRLKYIPTALLGAGFSERVPNARGAMEGRFRRTSLPLNSEFLLFWTDIFGVQAGDTLLTTITGPGGEILKTDKREIKENRTRHFQHVGIRKPKGGAWPAGEYKATVKLVRGNARFSETLVEEGFGVGVGR
jgi:hypothetical protein